MLSFISFEVAKTLVQAMDLDETTKKATADFLTAVALDVTSSQLVQ